MATGLVAKFRLAFDEASKQKLVDEAKQAGKATSTAYESTAGAGLQSFFTKIGGWLAAAFAVHKIVDFAQASIKAAQESETAWNELGFSLGKVGVNIDVVRGSLEKLGQRFLETTAFGDEEALRGLNSLVQITGDYNLSLHAIQVSADLAAAKHLSLEDASLLVGRALEGNTIQLKRMGVEIKNGLPLLGQLETMFGGAAQNELTTFAGKVKQLANFWQELKEEIGKALIAAGGGTSVFDTLIGAVKGATKWIKDNRDQVQQAGNALVNMASAITKLVIPALTELGRFPKLLSASFDDLAVSLNTIAAVLLDIAAFKMAGEGHFFDMQRLHELAAGYRVAANEARALAAAKREEVDASRPGSPGASLRQGGSRPSAGSGPDFAASNADRIAGDRAAGEKAVKEWLDFVKQATEFLAHEMEVAFVQLRDLSIEAAKAQDDAWKEANTKRLEEIRTQTTLRITGLNAATKKLLENLSKEDDALNAQAGRVIAAAVAANTQNKLAQDEEEKERVRRHNEFVKHWTDLGNTQREISSLAQDVLNLGDAWGVFGGKAGKALAETLSGIKGVADSLGGLTDAIASGSTAGIVGAGIGVLGAIGGAVGGLFHRNKDPGRMRHIDELYPLAASGDEAALESLLDLSGRGRRGEGYATTKARDYAWAKYQMAKGNADRIKAGEAGPVDTTDPRLANNVTPEQQARAADDAAREKERQIRANEEEGLRLRDLAEEGAAQQKLKSDAQGLSETLQQMVAAAILAQQKAEQVGETGPLGFDSPLFRDAKTRADRAFDEASRAVAEALGKQAEAGGVSANVEAGFTVQRTITETSAGRMIGELTTQSVWLEKIYTVLDKRLWPLPGMENGTPNGAGGITLNMDGQEVARIIGAHQAGNYQLRAELNGAAGMPSR